jgi:rhodanese-related sulfurtransferase
MKQLTIDVRTPDEWNEGHAPCTTSIPLDEITDHIEKLKQYDSIKLVCRSGNRVNHAIAILRENGLTMPMENLGAWQNVIC